MLKVKAQKDRGSFRLDVDFEVATGFTALFGPSGAGKTTTLNLISGLLKPEVGEIILRDRKLFSRSNRIDLKPQSRRLGYIFQESRLFPHLSVEENVMFGYRRTPASERRFLFEDVVEQTGISAFMNRRPAALSGGEKQRVALARAVLASPELLLLDEPLSAVDIPTKLGFLNFIKGIHQRFAIPIIYVSHDLASVLNFADDVVVLRDGKNVAAGPPYAVLEKMIARPLISGEDISNIMEVAVIGHHLEKGITEVSTEQLTFVLPHLDIEVGSKLNLNIPASEIILALDEPKNISATNIFPGKLTKLHSLGTRVLAEIDAGENFIVEIVPATVERLKLKAGGSLFLIIKASSFRRLEK